MGCVQSKNKDPSDKRDDNQKHKPNTAADTQGHDPQQQLQETNLTTSTAVAKSEKVYIEVLNLTGCKAEVILDEDDLEPGDHIAVKCETLKMKFYHHGIVVKPKDTLKVMDFSSDFKKGHGIIQILWESGARRVLLEKAKQVALKWKGSLANLL